jgi:hypothetical protein
VRIPWRLSAKAAVVADMVWRRQLTHCCRGAKKHGAVQQGARERALWNLPVERIDLTAP